MQKLPRKLKLLLCNQALVVSEMTGKRGIWSLPSCCFLGQDAASCYLAPLRCTSGYQHTKCYGGSPVMDYYSIPEKKGGWVAYKFILQKQEIRAGLMGKLAFVARGKAVRSRLMSNVHTLSTSCLSSLLSSSVKVSLESSSCSIEICNPINNKALMGPKTKRCLIS